MHYLTGANQYKTSIPFVTGVLLTEYFSLLIFYYFALIAEDLHSLQQHILRRA